MGVPLLGWEDPLEKEMATYSCNAKELITTQQRKAKQLKFITTQ